MQTLSCARPPLAVGGSLLNLEEGKTMAQRLKELEQENNKLKRLLAESMLDNAALKDLLSRK
ncbi:hypothetical protein MAFF211271_45980 (plasmid) [Ralstonia syzygii subsp. indonesiensis]|nr:hypothetical protein MAFF211271_45980 [Ralstonia pseudosolanacearum]